MKRRASITKRGAYLDESWLAQYNVPEVGRFHHVGTAYKVGFSSMLANRRSHRRIRFDGTAYLGAHAFRLAAAAVLALLAFALLLLADAAGTVPAPLSPLPAVAVHSQPKATATNTPTVEATATATSTVATPPPSISVVSPVSGSGPVGAHITVQGTNFTGSSVTLFGSTEHDCSVKRGTLAAVAPSGGNVNATFVWPVSFPVGTYYICAGGMTTSSAKYQVLSASPPTLSLSTLSVETGQPLTIVGKNFVGLAAGAGITLTENSARSGSSGLPSNAVVDSSGSFSVTWMVQGPQTGSVTIKAYGGFQGSAPAVLQASASVTIQPAATVTPTPIASPSAVPTAVTSIGTPSSPSSQTGNSFGLIVLLVIGIIISLLVIIGIVAYLILRRQEPDDGRKGPVQNPMYPGTGGFGGNDSYADATVRLPSWGSNGHGGTIFPTGQRALPPMQGQVSQWEEQDEQPGPDWQPRPMSGYYPEFGSSEQLPETPTRYGTAYDQRNRRRAPKDPWNDPPGMPPVDDDNQWPDLGGDTFGPRGGSDW